MKESRYYTFFYVCMILCVLFTLEFIAHIDVIQYVTGFLNSLIH